MGVIKDQHYYFKQAEEKFFTAVDEQISSLQKKITDLETRLKAAESKISK